MGNCRECGKEVSSQAKTCPNCGVSTPIKVKFSLFTRVLLVLFFGLGFLVFIGVMSDNQKKAEAQAAAVMAGQSQAPQSQPSQEAQSVEAISVSAAKLYADYQANEVAADQIYKGKPLLVSGIVKGINKDFTDDIYIEIVTSNMFESVHADMDKSQEQTAAALRRGQKIAVLCEGNGLVIGSPMLKSCSIQKVG